MYEIEREREREIERERDYMLIDKIYKDIKFTPKI